MICIDNVHPTLLLTKKDFILNSMRQISSDQTTKINLTEKPMASIHHRIETRKSLHRRL